MIFLGFLIVMFWFLPLPLWLQICLTAFAGLNIVWKIIKVCNEEQAMKIEEVNNFCEYEVYEYVKEKYHCLALCKEYNVAKTIAFVLAEADPNNDPYYVTCVNKPDTLIPGGGWYDRYQKRPDGRVEHSALG